MFMKEKPKDFFNIFERLKGNWHFILGNHDRRTLEKWRETLIEKHPRIKTITHYKRLVYKNKLLLLFHYEIKHWEHRGFEGRDKDRFRYDEVYHFFGHSHSKPDTKFDRWCLDVGIDCSECKILSFEEQMSRAKK